MFQKTMVRGLLAAALLAVAVSAQAANVFDMGGTISGGTWTGLASLQFVTVGNPGNVADTTGYGSVPYTYQMGKYDVTTGQYVAFLNSVATQSDPYGLYYSGMATVGGSNYGCGIIQSGLAGSYSYSVATAYQNFPVDYITWGDAARFCNWLDNGQPTSGTEAAGTTETGAYALNGATSNAQLLAVALPAHNGSGAAEYFIPSENESYKAAYYVGGGTSAGYWAYPTQSNTAPDNSLALATSESNDANYYIYTNHPSLTDPTNLLTPVGRFAASPGAYGTYDMGGDIRQWNEDIVDWGDVDYRGESGDPWNISGFDMNRIYYAAFDSPADESYDGGFRVAASEPTPEPTSIALLLSCALAFGIWRLRRTA